MQVYTIQVYQINSNIISVVIFESSEKSTTILVTISFEYGKLEIDMHMHFYFLGVFYLINNTKTKEVKM